MLGHVIRPSVSWLVSRESNGNLFAEWPGEEEEEEDTEATSKGKRKGRVAPLKIKIGRKKKQKGSDVS